MTALLDSIIDSHDSAPRVVSENHNVNSINWVAGMSDPGEMIGCGMYQELRRHNGEADEAYQERITVLLDKLPVKHRAKIIRAGREAAIKRAGLDTSNGRVNMMYNVQGGLPWTGLGVGVSGATNAKQARELSGTDFRVSKVQQFYDWNGTKRTATDKFALVREDTGDILGTVGRVYKPIQNDESTDYLDSVIGQFGAKYETAGSLYNGSSVWFLVHMPNQAFRVTKNDSVEPYVMFMNWHDGTGAAKIFPTAVRPICANTARIALHDGKGKGINIRHTGDIKDKINSAKNALGLAVESFTEYKEAATVLVQKPLEVVEYANGVLDMILDVTLADMEKGVNVFAATLAKTEATMEFARKQAEKAFEKRRNILDDILERYESDRCGIDGIRGSAWSAYQAVTDHADHAKQGREAQDLTTRKSRRFESSLIGDADELKQAAFEVAVNMTA